MVYFHDTGRTGPVLFPRKLALGNGVQMADEVWGEDRVQQSASSWPLHFNTVCETWVPHPRLGVCCSPRLLIDYKTGSEKWYGQNRTGCTGRAGPGHMTGKTVIHQWTHVV